MCVFSIKNKVEGQSIQFDTIPTGPYGQGSSISIIFKPVGVFPLSNRFELWLSDSNGHCTTSGAKQIGIYSSFYSTFINGTIPNGTITSSNYRLLVVGRDTVSNSIVAEDSTSYTISIQNNNGVSGNFISMPSYANPVSGYWLWIDCSGSANNNVEVDNNLTTDISTIVKDEFDTISNYSADVERDLVIKASNSIQLNNLLQAHYRLFNKTISSKGIILTQSWYFLNNQTNTPYTTNSSAICYSPTQPGSADFAFTVTPSVDVIKNPTAFFNFPGYVYIFKWDDGTDSSMKSIQQLINSAGSISHEYTSSSCNKTVTTASGVFYNTYGPSVTVNLFNPPCNQKPNISTLVTVPVFPKPIISFTGPDTACYGSLVNFINTTDLGMQGDQSTNGCTKPNVTYEWKVDGLKVSTDSNYSTSTLSVGSHSIELDPIYSSNNLLCHPDDFSQPICVQPNPNPSFLLNGLDSISDCAPKTIKTSNSTPSVACNPTTYVWEVVDSTGLTIAPGTGVYTVNTNLTDAMPTFLFNISGHFLIQLTATNSCGPLSLSKKVIINGVTNVTMPSNQTYCGTKTIDFSVSPNKPIYNSSGANEQYHWTVSGGTYTFVQGTSAASAYPQIQFSDYTTYTITLQFTNDCGTKTVSQQITFNQAPSPNAGNDTMVCYSLNSIPLNATVTGGNIISGAWSTSNGNGKFGDTSAAKTTYTFGTTDKLNGSVTLVYSVKTSSTACAVINAQRVITILPQNAITNSSPITICSGNYASFTPVSSTANSTYNWTSKVLSGTATGNTPHGTGAINDFLINTSNTLIDTVEYIIIPQNGSCNGTPDSLLVTINPKPIISLDNIAGTKVCATSTGDIVLKGLASNTPYTVNFNGTSVNDTSNASGLITIANLAAGTYKNISVTSAAGCNSDTIGPFTLKDPNPPTTPIASAANDILCSGSTLSLTATSTTSGVTYSWTGPNNFTNTAQSPTVSNIQTTGTGTYSVIAILAGCTSPADTVNVIVNQTPATPTIASIPSLCSGEQLTLNASTSTTGNISYNWTGPNGFVSRVGDTVINAVTAADSGFYKVFATNTNGTFTCTSQTDSILVVVRPSITQATIIGSQDTTICNFTTSTNNTGTLFGNLDASRPYEKGTWTVVGKPSGSNPVITNDTISSTIINFDKSGIYLVQWAISNGVCAPTTDTIQFNVLDKPAITTLLTTPSINVCADNPVTITIDTTGIYGQIKYWQIKQPYTATSWKDTLVQTPSITFNNVQDSLIVQLVVISKDTLHCGDDSAIVSLQINVAPPSFAGVASTNDSTTVCYNNNSGTLSLTGNTGSATWQSSTDSINYTSTNTTGQQYTYTNLTQNTWFRGAVKSGNCDTVFSNAIKITVVPSVTTSVAGNNVTLCADSIYQLQANTPSSIETGTWSWASTDSGTLDNVHNPTTFARGLKANTNYKLKWTITNNVCSPSIDSMEIINLGPLTNTIDTATQTICNSASVTVTGQTPTGGSGNYNYQWQVEQGNGWYSIPGATSMSYTFIADTTVILQRLVIDSPCTSASLQTTIYVQPPLGNNFITGSNQACINTSPGLLMGSVPTGAGGNFMYQWQSSTDTVNVGWANIPGADTQNYTPPVLNINDTNYYRRIVTTNLCSGNQANNSSGFVVFVRPNAVANWAITTDTSCAPFSINNSAVYPVTDTNTDGSYNWYENDSLYGSSATINPGFTLIPPYDSVTIKMVAVSRYGCKNDSLSSLFYTPPSPQTKFKVSDSSDCGPLADTLTNITPMLGYFHYSWNFGFDSTATSTLAQPGVVVFPPNPFNKDTIYTVTLTGFNQCDTLTYSRNIKVRSKAKAIFTPSATFGCSPLTDTFTNTSRGDSTTYVWQFGDGATTLAKDTLPVAHTYHTGSQDTFTVKLLAENYCGNDTSQYAIVVAAGTIKLRITVNGNELTGCNPSTVHFINTSQGALTFDWDFGDGNQDTSKQSPFNLDTVTHRYDSVGVFNVTINASNNCTDTTGFETIKVLSTPKAAFVATPDTVCIGHPISFTNESDATNGLIWNFGDGGSSLVTNPQYAYAKAGNYDVQLIAERQHPTLNTCVDTAIRQVTVVPSLPGFISVFDSVSVCVPFTVTFTNNNAVSSKTCTWSFGDTTTGTGNTVTHTFTKVGTYIVVMNAVDTGGCTYTATKQITVNGPVGSFTYDHGIVCGGTPINFVATVTGTDSLQWNFGNDVLLTTLPNTPVYYIYPQSGTFLPSVTLVSAKGTCTVQLKGTDSITIDYVKAGFSTSELKVCDTTTVNFMDTSSAYLGLKSWAWNFGNSKSSIIQNPSQSFLTSNTWPIQLIVKSNCHLSQITY
jgi:PKD repeat protein